MSMPTDIVLDTSTFSLVSGTSTSSMRKNPARELTAPGTLRIASETSKHGLVSSVLQLTDSELVPCGTGCEIVPVLSDVRLQLKLTFNPTEGRTDINTAIGELVAYMEAFLGDTALLAKFVNQEH